MAPDCTLGGERLQSYASMKLQLHRAVRAATATSRPPARIGRYSLMRRLHSGSAGQVFLARDIYSDDLVALKKIVMRKVDDSYPLAAHECWIQQQIDGHPNIVKLRGMCITSRHDVAIATEFMAGGDLFELYKQLGSALKESHFFLFAEQIASALVHCHVLNIAHCDVKPENVLLSSCGTIAKLADFGSSRHALEAKCYRTQGTEGFQSPEEVRGRYIMDLRASDVWALGVTFFNLLTGRLPWATADKADEDFAYHLRGKRSPRNEQLWAVIPTSVLGLLDEMMCVDSNARCSMQHVYDTLVVLKSNHHRE